MSPFQPVTAYSDLFGNRPDDAFLPSGAPKQEVRRHRRVPNYLHHEAAREERVEVAFERVTISVDGELPLPSFRTIRYPNLQ